MKAAYLRLVCLPLVTPFTIATMTEKTSRCRSAQLVPNAFIGVLVLDAASDPACTQALTQPYASSSWSQYR